jgi:hypothetical protein
MPSGFQQDSNQLQPAFYRVVLDMSNTSIYMDNNDEYSGAVNPFAWDNFSGSDQPTTLDNALRLARGNIRFQRIVEELTKYSDAQIIDLECNSNGDAITGNNVPTALAFTVRYDRFGIDTNDGVLNPLLAMEQQYLKSINNGSTDSQFDGTAIDEANLAICEAIMRALIENVTRSVRVFHPVEGTDPLVGEGVQDKIEARDANNDNNYSDLRNSITVNGPLDGTTVVSSDNDAQ